MYGTIHTYALHSQIRSSEAFAYVKASITVQNKLVSSLGNFSVYFVHSCRKGIIFTQSIVLIEWNAVLYMYHRCTSIILRYFIVTNKSLFA